MCPQTAGMSSTITRLHPDLPVCWEDPDTLRLGFERARARVPSPTAGAQRFIGLLAAGVALEALPREAERAGITVFEARRLLDQLAAALLHEPAGADGEPGVARAAAVPTVLCDDGREPPGLRAALQATELWHLDHPHRAGPAARFAVHVERYLEPLERAQRWLLRGLPHLLIRFTDGAVHVGPIVSAVGAPCHTCLTLTILERDPAYPAIAAQLAGRTPASESPAGVHMAAAYAALLMRRWLAGDATAHTTRVWIPVRAGSVTDVPSLGRVAPHPECACTLAADAPKAATTG